MYLPHKGEIQQNDALIAQGRNAPKHNVFTSQGWNTAKRCNNRWRKKCIKTQGIYLTRVKYIKKDTSFAQGTNTSKHKVFSSQGWNTPKRCIIRTREKCTKTRCITTQGWITAKRCINRTRKKCTKTQCIYHTRGKYSTNEASIIEGWDATQHNVFTAQGWNTPKRCINRWRNKTQNNMYFPHKGEIYQNDASIAEGRNASKHNVFTTQGLNTARTMHQSHKEDMHQNTMY